MNNSETASGRLTKGMDNTGALGGLTKAMNDAGARVGLAKAMNDAGVPTGAGPTKAGSDMPDVLRLSQSAAMFGGFLLLAVEIRFEHRALLTDDWHAWIPIVFCVLMLATIPLGTWFWHRGGDKALLLGYCLTACLGVVGLVFHSEGRFMQRLLEVLSIWVSTVQAGSVIEAHHPPLLAPAAFIGLGLIGILFSLSRKTDSHEKLTQ